MMNLEQSRLSTFQSWPANAEVDPQRIAKAGFYYTGNGLEVQCFSCGGKISEWNYGDQVMARHRLLNPDCTFVKDPVTSGNIPVVNRSPSLYSQVSESNQSSLPSSSLQSSSIVSKNLSPRHSENISSNTNNVETSSEGNNLTGIPGPSRNPDHNHPGTSYPVVDVTLFKSEAARLRSFASWPKSHIIRPESLAKTGFFYLQHGDGVKCAFCCGTIHGWEEGNDPVMEHRRHFPSCPLHYNMATGNVPLMDSVENTANTTPGQTASNTGGVDEIRPFSIPERGGPMRVLSASVPPDLDDLGIHSHRGPKHPRFSTIESRLRSFTNWSPNMRQTPHQLAQAGFYYTGQDDKVRCFHCDGGLRQWDENDEPWIEHARWFSKCTYVMLVKGSEFIENALAQHPPLLPACEFQNTVNNPSRIEQDQTENRLFHVSEEELDGLMNTPPVREAIDVGLDPSKIREVIQRKMESTGLPYSNPEALIEAVLDISSDTASPESTRDSPHSPVAEGEEMVPQPVSNNSPVGNYEGQPGPITVSRSLPSIASSNSEPSIQGGDARTQSMPRLDHEKNVQKVEENESSLEEENRRLKEARLCKICMDEEVGAVFVPCGHLATCLNCAASVGDCPVCRQPIKATVRTFLS